MNRPEMVIYRGTPAGKGPSLDGAPELAPAGGYEGHSADFFGGKHPFPNIIEADVNDGTFIFTNLGTGESTKVENFNLTVTGLKPGGTAQINGECDITGGGGRDHAVISGTVQGFDSPGFEALMGKLVFKSGFADVQAVVDMSTLHKPGAKVLKTSIKGDLQKAVTRLGAILALPEGAAIRGNIDSKIDAVAQPGRVILLEGQTSVTNLYLKIAPFLTEPFSSAQAVLSYRVDISPVEGTANIERFALRADKMNLDMSGVMKLDGAVDVKVQLSAPLEEAVARAAPAYASFGEVAATGDLDSDVEIKGTLGGVLALKGSSKIRNLDFAAGSYKYTDPDVTVRYDLEYDQKKGVVKVNNIQSALGLLALKLDEAMLKLGEKGHYMGKLDLVSDMEEVNKLLKLPVSFGSERMGKVELDFKGSLTTPFYNDLTADGKVGVDEFVYDTYKITKIEVERLALDNNHLDVQFKMLVNGAPVDADVDVDLDEDSAAGTHHMRAELHAIKVPVNHALKKGKLSGLFTLHVDKAEADVPDWGTTFKKTLTANGTLKVEQGKLTGSKIITGLLKFFKRQGTDYQIDLLTTDFEVKDEKIYTPKSKKSKKFMVVGKPFDAELSGWIGLDKQIDYLATIVIPKENLGKDLQEVFDAIGQEPNVTLRFTGPLKKPKYRIVGHPLLQGLMDLKHAVKGVEGFFKDIFR